MYESHPVFQPELDPDTRLWRYMDLAKFISMLKTRSLFFTRQDVFEDKWEGHLPNDLMKQIRDADKITLERLANTRRENDKVFQNLIRSPLFKLMPDRFRILDDWPGYRTEQILLHKFQLVANCWHKSDHESAAMWEKYSSSGSGIAIETNFRRLSDSFATHQEPIYIGSIDYHDFGDNYPFVDSPLKMAMIKRISFEYEQEIRAIIWRHIDLADPKYPLPFPAPGELIPTDIQTLINSVYVSPGSPPWMAEIVTDILDKYDIDVPVHYSSMDEDPIY